MFDENDEMIVKEDHPSPKSEKEEDVLQQKLKAVQKERAKEQFKSLLTVNLGHEEYDKGKHKITKDIFEGNDKTQNAELFLENLNKTKIRHLEEKKTNSATRKEEDKTPETEPKQEDPVIMNIDPKQFDKKDQIFMDFFSIYGKSFVEQKKGG